MRIDSDVPKGVLAALEPPIKFQRPAPDITKHDRPFLMNRTWNWFCLSALLCQPQLKARCPMNCWKMHYYSHYYSLILRLFTEMCNHLLCFLSPMVFIVVFIYVLNAWRAIQFPPWCTNKAFINNAPTPVNEHRRNSFGS